MKLNTFAIPFMQDERMLYTKEYLEKQGFNYLTATENADFVVLPVPVKKNMLDGLSGKVIFLGLGDYENTYDYMKNENFVLKNAFLTAEGAVSLLRKESNISFYKSNILIIGYGRIGKALHKILSGYGANITICSRSSSSKSLAEFNGAKHILFDELPLKNNYDFVFNTVPHIVLTKPELKALKSGVIIVDLASFPGGVDTLVADSLKIKLISARGVPSLYTVKSAGEFIGEAVLNIIEEELT